MGGRWIVHVLFGVALAFLPGLVRAQPENYRRVIADAVAEFDAGHFPEARALFQQAHELSPSARTLRGLGLASFEMREYADAFRALSAALTDERNPLTEAQRTSVRGVLEQTRRFFGVFELSVQPANARVFIDDEPVQLESNGRLFLTLGTHSIVARAPRLRDVRRTIRVIGGEDSRLVLNLDDTSAQGQELSDPSSPSAPSTGTTEDTPAHASDSSVPLGILIGGGVASAAAIVLGLAWWLPRQEEADLCAPPAMCSNTAEVVLARDASVGTTLALAALGLGGLITGTVLFFTTAEGARATALRCTPGLGAMACEARF